MVQPRGAVGPVVTGLLLAASGLAAHACGGTTGSPEPSIGGDDAGGLDATIADGASDAGEGGVEAGEDAGLYTDLFDVVTVYADRDLPEIAATPGGDGGAEGGGFPFPTTCPPYLTVSSVAGTEVVPISIGTGMNELPADPTSDGGSTFAADGSACLYPWFGSQDVDECTAQNYAISGADSYPAFPPCNWCPPGSGAVTQGPNPGEDRTLACWLLYQCMEQSQCYLGQNGVSVCLCGDETPTTCSTDPHPPGPCATEELTALETNDPNVALTNFIDSRSPGAGGATCGSNLNYVYSVALGDDCFPQAGDP